jgi:hypothetical protein
MTCDIAEEMTSAAATALRAANETLLPRGFAPSPQLFVFDRTADRGLVAHVVCRRFYPGSDAATALRELGRLAAAIGGTDLLLLWEEADLGRALYGPDAERPPASVLWKQRLIRTPSAGSHSTSTSSPPESVSYPICNHPPVADNGAQR